MQVIPRDPGWDVLAQSLMTLYNAEIKNKALNLQEIQHQIELVRQTGDPAAYQKLTGRSLPIANPVYKPGPQANPLAALKNLSGSGETYTVPGAEEQYISSLPGTEISTGTQVQKQGLDNLLALKAAGQEITPDLISNLANPTPGIQKKLEGLRSTGEQVSGLNQARQQAYEAGPASKKNLDYRNYGDAIQQMINNLHTETQGKSNPEIKRLYENTVAGIMNASDLFRRRDITSVLGPLKDWQQNATGGGTTTVAKLSKALNEREIVVTTDAKPFSAEWTNEVIKTAARQGLTISPSDITNSRKYSQGAPRPTSEVEQSMAIEKNKQSAEAEFKILNNKEDMTNAERLAEANRIASTYRVNFKTLKDNKSKIVSFEYTSNAPMKPGQTEEGYDNWSSFKNWAANLYLQPEKLVNQNKNVPNSNPKKNKPTNANEYLRP
jgi:hypothetical protein